MYDEFRIQFLDKECSTYLNRKVESIKKSIMDNMTDLGVAQFCCNFPLSPKHCFNLTIDWLMLMFQDKKFNLLAHKSRINEEIHHRGHEGHNSALVHTLRPATTLKYCSGYRSNKTTESWRGSYASLKLWTLKDVCWVSLCEGSCSCKTNKIGAKLKT